MWARNLLFISLIAGGAVTLAGALFPEKIPLPVAARVASETPIPDYELAVRQVDDSLQQDWTRNGLQSATRASDLTIARRLTLALTGSIPSLQQIRRFESQPSGERLNDLLSHL